MFRPRCWTWGGLKNHLRLLRCLFCRDCFLSKQILLENIGELESGSSESSCLKPLFWRVGQKACLAGLKLLSPGRSRFLSKKHPIFCDGWEGGVALGLAVKDSAIMGNGRTVYIFLYA